MNENSGFISRFGGGRPQGRGGNNGLSIPQALAYLLPTALSLGALYYSYNRYKNIQELKEDLKKELKKELKENLKGEKGDPGEKGEKGDPGDPAYLFPDKKIDKFISDNNITDDNSAINFLMKYCSLSKDEAENIFENISDNDGKIDRREASLLMLIKLNHDMSLGEGDHLFSEVVEDFKSRYNIDGIESVKEYLMNEEGFSEKEAEEEIKSIDSNHDGKLDNREIAKLMLTHNMRDPFVKAAMENEKKLHHFDGSIESAKKYLMEAKNMTEQQADEEIEKINKDHSKELDDKQFYLLMNLPRVDTFKSIIKSRYI